MGRRNRSSSHSASELLNFHFSKSVPPQTPNPSGSSNSQRHDHGRNNNSRGQRKNKRHQQQRYQRSAQDRASARRTAKNGMFYLHSSADHAFILTRQRPDKTGHHTYSFSGCDDPVSWDSVRAVTQIVQVKPAKAAASAAASEDHTSCPICLDDFTCPRITKCGHAFCLPCILRHNQSSYEINPYTHVKCPCCGIPLITNDLKPVTFRTVDTKVVGSHIRLKKLHRHRECPAPYLPLPDAKAHGNPHTAPCTTDGDSIYSRFNYVDPHSHQQRLSDEHSDLTAAATELSRNNCSYAAVELTFVALALEIVDLERARAASECDAEIRDMNRFKQPTSGMYLKQSPALVPNIVEADAASEPNEVCKVDMDEVRNALAEIDEAKAKEEVSLNASFSQSAGAGSVSESACDDTSDVKERESKPRNSKNTAPSSMYLSPDSVLFYQSEDGQLVFLNGFNVTCLLAEFTKLPPQDSCSGDDAHDTESMAASKPSAKKTAQAPPLPDYIEGNIVEVETIHLTPEARRRLSFLSHLPLYTDVTMVELDLGRVLSNVTKKKFSAEFAKRKKKRNMKKDAEKKADREAKEREAKLVEERKARIQTIDPNDTFFRHAAAASMEDMGDFNALFPTNDVAEYHQASSGNSATAAAGGANHLHNHPGSHDLLNFSQAARGVVVTQSVDDFPTLGTSSAAPATQPRTSGWGAPASAAATRPAPVKAPGGGRKGKGKKKKGGQKMVLFSTGGQRGSG